MLYQEPLPYLPDASGYYAAIADLPWAAWLDSAGMGRYDIVCAQPVATLTTRGAMTEVSGANGTRLSAADPFDLLREQLGQPCEPVAGIPFCGGALGYWGYDLARRLMHLPEQALDAGHLPEMAAGIYDWAVLLDHKLKTAQLVSRLRAPQTAHTLPEILARLRKARVLPGGHGNGVTPDNETRGAMAASPTPTREDTLPSLTPALSRRERALLRAWGEGGRGGEVSLREFHVKDNFRVHGPIAANFTRAGYEAAFGRIRDYLHEGDCYQVNLAQRYAARASGDAFRAYLELRRLSPAPYSAFLDLPHAQVLCASPECFLHVRDGVAETRPIKGTRPRMENATLDVKAAYELQESSKDRAENLMIVDLLRNDLSRSCAPGSVRVRKLFEVESFAQVHHLVSTISGRLAPGQDALSLLRNCFPGGSVTGAPKLRAMQIIEELEPHRRGVYCGALGYAGYDGSMGCNIAIRTLVYSAGEIRFWAGGGIVADSAVSAEFNEILAKAAGVLELLKHYGGVQV